MRTIGSTACTCACIYVYILCCHGNDGFTPLYIHLSKIQHSINHGQLVYMSAIHLLMFGSLFDIPRASGSREISQTNSSQAGVYLHIYTSWPWFIYTMSICNNYLHNGRVKSCLYIVALVIVLWAKFSKQDR